VEIELERARDLVRLWHSRLPETDKGNLVRNTYCVCYGAEYDGLFYAAAIWTSPVARLLSNPHTIELRRLAMASDAPKNLASRMLRIMALLLAKKHPKVGLMISYQDTAVHRGTIYKAAGWRAVATNRSATTWNMPNRQRIETQSSALKIRWEKQIS